jgi:hypothetical protein
MFISTLNLDNALEYLDHTLFIILCNGTIRYIPVQCIHMLGLAQRGQDCKNAWCSDQLGADDLIARGLSS